jgi:hypothetical protein
LRPFPTKSAKKRNGFVEASRFFLRSGKAAFYEQKIDIYAKTAPLTERLHLKMRFPTKNVSKATKALLTMGYSVSKMNFGEKPMWSAEHSV